MVEQKSRRRPRLSSEDWVRAAADALGRHGVSGVAVEPLADELGVTKGSFYSHFRDRDELLRSALATWRDAEAARVAELRSGSDSAAGSLDAVVGDMFGNDSAGRAFAHVCAAGADSSVAPYALEHALAKVGVVAELLVADGMPPTQAEKTADLLYTAYIGYWRIKSMAPPGDSEILPGYLQNLKETLLPRSCD